MPDGGQDIGQLAVLGSGVVDVVGDDDRQAEPLGQRRRLGDEPVVVGQEVVRELDEEPAGRRAVAPAEQRRVALRHGPRPGPIAHPQPAGQLAVATARQRDEALGVLGEERLAEARHALRAGHVGVRHEPAQAPPADLRAGQQDQMRAADPFADPAQVLLDRRPVTGQPGARRARSDGQALDHVGRRAGSPTDDGAVVAVGAAGRRSRPGRRPPDRAARSRAR